MTAQEKTEDIERIAKALESADRDWRIKSGYTGSPVHRPAYFWFLASQLVKSNLENNAATTDQP
jgi:hypothetical protein